MATFPFEELYEAIGNAQTLIILDRALSPGGPGGPAFSEIRSALYSQKVRPNIVWFCRRFGWQRPDCSGIRRDGKERAGDCKYRGGKRIRNVWGERIMQNYGVYAARLAPKIDGLAPGHRACTGCGEALAVRIACKAMGRNVIVATPRVVWRSSPLNCRQPHGTYPGYIPFLRTRRQWLPV